MTESNGKIAPHAGRELSMVLSGEKLIGNVAVYNNEEQYTRIQVLAKTSSLLVTMFEGTGGQSSVTFTKPENGHLIRKYMYLQEQLVRGEITDKQYHRLSGKLFGYSDEDIESFIQAEFSCDCSRCNPKKYVGV